MSGKDRMRQIQVLDERGQILQGKLGGEGDIVRSRFTVGAHVPHNRALARRGQGLELCVERVVIRAGTVGQHDRVPRPSTVRVSEHASRSVKPTSQIYHLLYISDNLKLSLGSPDKPWDAVAGTHGMPIPDSDSQDLIVGIQHDALGASVRVRPTDLFEKGSPVDSGIRTWLADRD